MKIKRALINNILKRASLIFSATMCAVVVGCTTNENQSIVESSHNNVLPQSLQNPNSQSALEVDWYKPIQSDELDFFLRESFSNNFELESGYWKVLASDALRSQKNGDRLPTLDTSLTGNRTYNKSTNLTQETFQLGLNLNWELDLWGRLKQQYKAQDLEFEATQKDFEYAKLSIGARVAQAYFDLISKQKIWELTQASAENAKLSRNQIKELYERGLRSSLDLRLANINTSDFQSRTIEARSQRDQSARNLEILLGRYPTDTIRVPSTLPEVPRTNLNSISARVLNFRPDVLSAQKRLIAQEKRLESSQKLLLPQIKLTSSIGTTSAEFQDLVNSDFSFWNLGGSILQPIFQGQKIRKGIEVQNAKLQQAIADYKSQLLTVFKEVEFLISRSQELENLLSLEKIRASDAKEAEKTAWEQYKKGITNINTYLQTEQTHLQARTQLIQIQNESLRNYIQVHLALGYPNSLQNEANSL